MQLKRKTVQLFESDLWKDQRKLELLTYQNSKVLKKSYNDRFELQTEISILEFLRNEKNLPYVPKVFNHYDESALIEYRKGIRVFNFLVELDKLLPKYGIKVSNIKEEIIKKCEVQQMYLQKALVEWAKDKPQNLYPLSKIEVLIEVLADCLIINHDLKKIRDEIAKIYLLWEHEATVPFRDATSKNMILESEELYLGNFKNEEERSKYIDEIILNGEYKKLMQCEIVNFDFSSCVHNSTYEDDLISLKYHERTWKTAPTTARELVWDNEPNGKRAAITFFVRYYRFGGRKAAYRLIHPSGHRIRFRYDDDTFYFERLPEIMRSLWPEADEEIPNLLEFTSCVAKKLKSTNFETDNFLEHSSKPHKRTYYVDVFPL